MISNQDKDIIDIPLSNIKTVTANVHASHPFKHRKNHDLLLDYIIQRLVVANTVRDDLVARFQEIDTQLSGHILATPQDRQRIQANARGESPKAVEINPTLVLTQLNRGVTYLLSVFSPEAGMYEAIAQGKDQTLIANAITERMNQHSLRAAHFRQLALFLLNALKYNFAGIHIEWHKEYGTKFVTEPGQNKATVQPNEVVWQGNKITALDPYNILWDQAVEPIDIHSHAEFCAVVKIKTAFQILRLAEAGALYNTDRYVRVGKNTPNGEAPGVAFYRWPATVRTGTGSSIRDASGNVNWSKILNTNDFETRHLGNAVELLHVFIRIPPKEFGLVPANAVDRNKLEIWKIGIANSLHITSAEQVTNLHNRLPFGFAMPAEDNLGLQSKSYGEQLLPFQNFAAFLLNAHVKATRKNIYDIIIYDPLIVDLKAAGDDVAARIPLKSSGYGRDITKALWSPNTSLDTRSTMADFNNVLELMEYIFPTRQVQQVADLQRATQYQAAAVVQGGARDNWRIARMVEDQAMQPTRMMQYSNLMQFGDPIKLTMPDGSVQEISPAQLVSADLEFTLGDGLRTIDKMSVIQNLKEIINVIIQNQSALEQFDIPALLNWWSQFLGVREDLSQFYTPRQAPQQQQQQQQQQQEAPPQ